MNPSPFDLYLTAALTSEKETCYLTAFERAFFLDISRILRQRILHATTVIAFTRMRHGDVN